MFEAREGRLKGKGRGSGNETRKGVEERMWEKQEKELIVSDKRLGMEGTGQFPGRSPRRYKHSRGISNRAQLLSFIRMRGVQSTIQLVYISLWSQSTTSQP